MAADDSTRNRGEVSRNVATGVLGDSSSSDLRSSDVGFSVVGHCKREWVGVVGCIGGTAVDHGGDGTVWSDKEKK